jgi:hypothetical protein
MILLSAAIIPIESKSGDWDNTSERQIGIRSAEETPKGREKREVHRNRQTNDAGETEKAHDERKIERHEAREAV